MPIRPLFSPLLAACTLLTVPAPSAGAQSSPSPPSSEASSRPGVVTPRERSASRAPVLPRVGFAYRSVFDAFRGFSDAPVGSWREANDTVTRIGGWRAYAAEAQAAPTETDPPVRRPEAASPQHAPGHGGTR